MLKLLLVTLSVVSAYQVICQDQCQTTCQLGCAGCYQAEICANLPQLMNFTLGSNDTRLVTVIHEIQSSCKAVQDLPSANYDTTCTIICLDAEAPGSTCTSNCIDCQDIWLCQRIETALNQTNITAVLALVQPMQSLCSNILSLARIMTPDRVMVGLLLIVCAVGLG